MFPTDNISDFTITTTDLQTISPDIKISFNFDFVNKEFTVIDGKLGEINTIEAVKQWIVLFLLTDLNKVPIYKGLKFGTTLKKIIGYKSLNNGFFESELQREIEEGFLLNPAISKVTYFNIEKIKDKAIITLNIMLKNGQIIEGLTIYVQ